MLTKPHGSFDRRDAKPGMAYFAGTGPRDKYCKDCAFIGSHTIGSRTRSHCSKRSEMGGGGPQALSKFNDACKYFEEKADGRSKNA